jgi:hypothetical protein
MFWRKLETPPFKLFGIQFSKQKTLHDRVSGYVKYRARQAAISYIKNKLFDYVGIK